MRTDTSDSIPLTPESLADLQEILIALSHSDEQSHPIDPDLALEHDALLTRIYQWFERESPFLLP